MNGIKKISITKQETFHCESQSGDDIGIIFTNDVFDYVKFQFSGSYSREEWKVLAEIEKEISRIEAKKGGEKGKLK